MTLSIFFSWGDFSDFSISLKYWQSHWKRRNLLPALHSHQTLVKHVTLVFQDKWNQIYHKKIITLSPIRPAANVAVSETTVSALPHCEKNFDWLGRINWHYNFLYVLRPLLRTAMTTTTTTACPLSSAPRCRDQQWRRRQRRRPQPLPLKHNKIWCSSSLFWSVVVPLFFFFLFILLAGTQKEREALTAVGGHEPPPAHPSGRCCRCPHRQRLLGHRHNRHSARGRKAI